MTEVEDIFHKEYYPVDDPKTYPPDPDNPSDDGIYQDDEIEEEDD